MQGRQKQYFFARVFSDTNLYKVCISNMEEFRYGAKVIIATEFDTKLAVVTSLKIAKELKSPKSYSSGNLIRYATEEDKIKRDEIDKKSHLIKKEISSLINYFQLDMNLTNILIPLSEDSICIYYTAKKRVDFRYLLVQLKHKYKTKIIMRHINQKERISSFHYLCKLF
jgi:cell fate regulator YaaT (PSP1 superfamily)